MEEDNRLDVANPSIRGIGQSPHLYSTGCGWWVVLICCERKILQADDRWLVLIWCERKILLTHSLKITAGSVQISSFFLQRTNILVGTSRLFLFLFTLLVVEMHVEWPVAHTVTNSSVAGGMEILYVWLLQPPARAGRNNPARPRPGVHPSHKTTEYFFYYV